MFKYISRIRRFPNIRSISQAISISCNLRTGFLDGDKNRFLANCWWIDEPPRESLFSCQFFFMARLIPCQSTPAWLENLRSSPARTARTRCGEILWYGTHVIVILGSRPYSFADSARCSIKFVVDGFECLNFVMRNKINAWYESSITTTTMARRRSSFRQLNRSNAPRIRWIIREPAIRRIATRSPQSLICAALLCGWRKIFLRSPAYAGDHVLIRVIHERRVRHVGHAH